MPLTDDIIALLLIGAASGLVGGMLGFGGSILMVPLMVGLLGRDLRLVQAAAMIVNALIALPAVWAHHRARAVPWGTVMRMLPAGLVAIVIGVEVGNAVDPRILKVLFGLFLAWVVISDVVKIIRRRLGATRRRPPEQSPGWGRSTVIATPVGFAAGVLGIGGGPIAVPLLQAIGHRSLRRSIGASSALMCVTAIIGAARKNQTLPDSMPVSESLRIVAIVAPTAILTALLGAWLTHRVPVKWLRVILLSVLVWSCYLMFESAFTSAS